MPWKERAWKLHRAPHADRLSEEGLLRVRLRRRPVEAARGLRDDFFGNSNLPPDLVKLTQGEAHRATGAGAARQVSLRGTVEDPVNLVLCVSALGIHAGSSRLPGEVLVDDSTPHYENDLSDFRDVIQRITHDRNKVRRVTRADAADLVAEPE